MAELEQIAEVKRDITDILCDGRLSPYRKRDALLALIAAHEQPLIDALREAKLRFTNIECTANIPFSVHVDVKNALVKIDLALAKEEKR